MKSLGEDTQMLTIRIEDGCRAHTIYKDLYVYISSVESQKGPINNQRCSIENQKGTITVQSMVITPFWFSTEHLWIVIAPFWFSTDGMYLHFSFNLKAEHSIVTISKRIGTFSTIQHINVSSTAMGPKVCMQGAKLVFKWSRSATKSMRQLNTSTVWHIKCKECLMTVGKWIL